MGREGWEDVLMAWAAVGSVATSMRMVWTDRNRVWRKVEVALVEQQTAEAREGLAGGRRVWRVRAQSLGDSVEEWLVSNAAATRTRPFEIWKGGWSPLPPCPEPSGAGGAGQRALPERRRCWRLRRKAGV